MRRGSQVALAVAALAVAACSQGNESSSEGPLYTGTRAAPPETTVTHTEVRLPELRVPATFVTISVEPPIESLNLRADGVFLSRTRLRSGDQEHDIGRWKLSDDNSQLLLYGGGDAVRRYAIDDPSTLAPLDGEGVRHESADERRLGRSDLYDPIHDSMRWIGMARYMADAAVFTECASQLRLPIAMERDYPAFEAAYLEQRPEPGGPLLITLTGHIEERPAMEGTGTDEVLVVERFEAAWPAQSCPSGSEFRPSLRNTHWELVRVLGIPASAPPGGVLPYLVLDTDRNRARGSLGCQEYTCTYEQNESFLRFQGLAKSSSTCDGSEGGLGPALEEALRTCTSYRIEGMTLYLYGEEETTARFRAVLPN